MMLGSSRALPASESAAERLIDFGYAKGYSNTLLEGKICPEGK
jgi:hypothetical protein